MKLLARFTMTAVSGIVVVAIVSAQYELKGAPANQWRFEERAIGPYDADPMLSAVSWNGLHFASVEVASKLMDYRDGRRRALGPAPGSDFWVIVDGSRTKIPEGVTICSLSFSSDGGHFAYLTHKNAKWSVVVDGKPGVDFDEVSDPIFSPDGRRTVYSEKKGLQVQGGVGRERAKGIRRNRR